jgi:drug/metabolite transporter (DMT)-like permease
MSHAETSGRVALLAGLSAAFIAGAFASLHGVLLRDWPAAALDGPGTMLAYFTAGMVFQFGIPVLCLAAFIFGTPARRLWTARIGLACAVTALLGYALYVRSCLDMIR